VGQIQRLTPVSRSNSFIAQGKGRPSELGVEKIRFVYSGERCLDRINDDKIERKKKKEARRKAATGPRARRVAIKRRDVLRGVSSRRESAKRKERDPARKEEGGFLRWLEGEGGGGATCCGEHERGKEEGFRRHGKSVGAKNILRLRKKEPNSNIIIALFKGKGKRGHPAGGGGHFPTTSLSTQKFVQFIAGEEKVRKQLLISSIEGRGGKDSIERNEGDWSRWKQKRSPTSLSLKKGGEIPP